MNRRLFLQRLTAGLVATAATAVLDPEELLWTPGRKSFVFLDGYGKPGGNQLLTPQWITKEALRVLENNLTFSRAINRQYDSGCFGGPSPTRMDVLYGWAPIQPERKGRVS